MSQSKHFPDSFYRVTVKGLCVRDGKLLMVKESEKLSGIWELPGGGLDFGEDPKEGLRREVKEEMGLTVSRISKEPVYVWIGRFENRRKMDWYYVCVLGYRIEFDTLHFIPSDECVEVAFHSKEGLQALALNDQLRKLPEIFNPEDFSKDF